MRKSYLIGPDTYSFFSFSESDAVKAIRQAAITVCSLSETEFDIRFNPDVFSPSVRHAEPSQEKLMEIALLEAKREKEAAEKKEKEESESKAGDGDSASEKQVTPVKPKPYPSMELQVRLNREACEFLVLFQIPQFIRDITSNRLVPLFQEKKALVSHVL